MPEPYGTLAAVYEWFTPDALLEPEGAFAAFADVVGELPAGARVLDCAAGPSPTRGTTPTTSTWPSR